MLLIAGSSLSLFLAGTYSASAGWFFGTDTTTLGAELGFTNGTPYQNGSDLYNLEPYRVKVGYRGETAGIEVNAYTNQDKTIASFNGLEANFAMENTVGVYLHLHERWAYARLGVTWMDSTFSAPAINASESSTLALPTIAIGVEYKIGKHFFFSADYTYAEGTGKYPAIVTGTGRVPVTVQGFGAGVNLEF